MSHEQWRPVPGFSGYEVSSEGRVRSFRVPRYLSTENRAGHRSVWLMKDGRPRRIAVHRLVLLSFDGPPPPGCEACHNDGDPANNRLENLRWDSHRNNMRDKRRHGTQPRGQRHHARMARGKAKRVKELLASGATQSAVARSCGVSQSIVSQIKHGKHWTDGAVAAKTPWE